MALIQKNGGTVSQNASIATSLPGATTAGNTILIFAQGTGTISTPAGFTSRSPQVLNQGFYFFEKLVATGNASDTPTLTMAGAYTATWQIVEYSNMTAYDTSSGNIIGSGSNAIYTTPSITPASGNKRLVAFIGAWSVITPPVTWTSGDPQGWTNFFTGQQSNSTSGLASPANQNAIASGFADYHVIAAGAAYSTTAMLSNVPSSRAPASIIAAYTTSDAPAATGPQFRSYVATSIASAPNTVLPPQTIIDNDILILTLYMGQDTGSPPPTPTLPAGFTLIDSTTFAKSPTQGVFRVAWKRAASEGTGTYTITHATAVTQASMSVYSDCILTGSPIDAYSKAFVTDPTSSGATATATSITTTVDLTKLLFVAHNWVNSQALTPPTGFTERFDGLIYNADKTQAVAGASGAVSNGTGNAANEPWSAFLIALKPVAAAVGVTVGPTGSAMAITSGTVSVTTGGAPAAPSASTRHGLMKNIGRMMGN